MARSKGLVNRICEYNDALSEPQRVKMMKIIGSSPANSMSVSDIANTLGLSQPSATKHLKILYDADLVQRTRIGMSVFYSLNLDTINDYHNLLEMAFIKGFTPCLYRYQCNECPNTDTCA